MNSQKTGAQVTEARTAAGWSQTALAVEMSSLGFRWHQQTVANVESGSRPLRWDEGLALRSLIGFSLSIDSAGIVRDALLYRRILAVIGEAAS